MILTEEVLSRITVEDDNDELRITVDVHGMKCWEVRRLLNNLILLSSGSFTMEIIHGYIHGTAIKEMIANDAINPRIINRYEDTWHYGVTYLNVA